MTNPAITTRELLLYGVIALPVAFAGFPLYVLAPDFYATHYGMSLSLLGSLLLFIRLFDAVQDPLIGWLADQWRDRYFPVVFSAGVVLCGAVFALFNLMHFTPAIWFSFSMILAVGGYSVLTIILGTYATLWTEDKDDQTRIAATREGFSLIGLVIAVSLPTLLLSAMKLELVFLWYAGILAFLMGLGIICFARLPLPARQSEQRQEANIMAALRLLPSSSRRFFLIYGLSMLASSIPAVLVIFFVRDLLQAEALTGLFLLLYFLSGAISMPFWKNFSVHFGKYRAWVCSNLLAVMGFIGAYFLGAGDVWAFGVVCIVSGFALGADLTLPPSILADDIHAAHNQRFSGTHYALLAFCSKASLALASAITFPVLELIGFKPQGVNSADALWSLSAAYALIPCGLKLAAAGLLYWHFIRAHTGGYHETAQDNRDDRSSHHA